MITIGQFMRESNWIEGDRLKSGKGKLFKNDVTAAQEFLAEPITQDSLFKLHRKLAECRPYAKKYKDQWGNYRTCDVWIGERKAPAPSLVWIQMDELFATIPHSSHPYPFFVHAEFERIHPFVDLNGRVGRLLWLHLMGGETKLPFLQAYYYQALDFHSEMIHKQT